MICDWNCMIHLVTTALCAHRCVLWEMFACVKAAGLSDTFIILQLCTVAYTRSQQSSNDTWSLTNGRESPAKYDILRRFLSRLPQGLLRCGQMSVQLLPYIARQLVTTGKGRELTQISLWFWGHYTHHQVWPSQILQSSHTAYLCLLYGSRNKQRLFTYTVLNLILLMWRI
jgi:hypothetical protein